MIRFMGDSDAAFLWESEAIRSAEERSTRPIAPTAKTREQLRSQRGDDDWLTLRQASEATGIPVPTLRKWARRDTIPSYLDATPAGELRMVSKRGVLARAELLHRDIHAREPSVSETVEPQKPPPVIATEDVAEESGPAEPDVSPGTMLVPIDAWDKMLLQLGNLHEAGQQLAEARERAGKAETESLFLKERLTELRAELAEAKDSPRQFRYSPEPVIDEPIAHIPIESDEDIDEEPEDDLEIMVRDLSKRDPESIEPETDTTEPSMTLTGYSIKMMNHIYSTWRGRPRR